ncbi:hypothetical protein BJ170DRAFT_728405 [Xylariales sp. AK1849]|nr:hypothetical protein BJ170DRAFT_728405 [Xylariales sp. AK1849]
MILSSREAGIWIGVLACLPPFVPQRLLKIHDEATRSNRIGGLHIWLNPGHGAGLAQTPHHRDLRVRGYEHYQPNDVYINHTDSSASRYSDIVVFALNGLNANCHDLAATITKDPKMASFRLMSTYPPAPPSGHYSHFDVKSTKTAGTTSQTPPIGNKSGSAITGQNLAQRPNQKVTKHCRRRLGFISPGSLCSGWCREAQHIVQQEGNSYNYLQGRTTQSAVYQVKQNFPGG